jgi:hypothetical protein
MVILKTCESAIEAHLLKHRLENEDIPCFISNEHFANLMPNYFRILGNGVHVHVAEEDLEKARNLLAENNSTETITCPNCNSANVRFGLGARTYGKWLWALLSAAMLIPFNNLNNKYTCRDCKHEFQA